MRQLIVFTIFATLYLPSASFAQLAWTQRDIALKPELGVKEVKAEYPFTNNGTYAITIIGIRPSCDCTAATLAKKVYKPGESGKLEVDFKPGNRQGLQQKQILIETDETSASQTVLTLRIDLTVLVKVDKPVLYWNLGDTASQQTFKVTMAKPTKLLEVRSPDGLKFESKIREIKAGEQYEVDLTPATVAKPIMARLELVTDAANGAPPTRMFAMVGRDQPSTRPATQPVPGATSR